MRSRNRTLFGCGPRPRGTRFELGPHRHCKALRARAYAAAEAFACEESRPMARCEFPSTSSCKKRAWSRRFSVQSRISMTPTLHPSCAAFHDDSCDCRLLGPRMRPPEILAHRQVPKLVIIKLFGGGPGGVGGTTKKSPSRSRNLNVS